MFRHPTTDWPVSFRQGSTNAAHTISTSLLALGLFLTAPIASSAELAIEWDEVSDSRVAYYEVQWGESSRSYQQVLETSSNRLTLSGLEEGKTFYIAARACSEGGVICSDFSNELNAATPGTGVADDPSTGAATSTNAGFTASVTSGSAPLTVTFESMSQGSVESCEWDFGDGTKATGCQAVKTYSDVGRYSVTLSVEGSDGRDALSKLDLIDTHEATPVVEQEADQDQSQEQDQDLVSNSELPIAFGELLVDDRWQRVEFGASFIDPVVVAKTASAEDSEPVTLRIDAVDETGFWIRVQEWDYLDGAHAEESVSYMVMERGRHQLPNGAWVEADELTIDAAKTSYEQALSAPFAEVPIVIAAVVTDNDTHAVTTRLTKLSLTVFSVGLQEQRSSRHRHGQERIAYIAWEPSMGQVGGLEFEAAQAPDDVGHAGATIAFAKTYDAPPLLMADMQSWKERDTATLRMFRKDQASVDLWVEEETSRKNNARHAQERVGYILLKDMGAN